MRNLVSNGNDGKMRESSREGYTLKQENVSYTLQNFYRFFIHFYTLYHEMYTFRWGFISFFEFYYCKDFNCSNFEVLQIL